MRSIAQIVGGLLAITLIASEPSRADSEPGAVLHSQTAEPSVGEVIIGEIERRILQDYYERNARAWTIANPDAANGKSHKQMSLPPGIAKKGTLPPGIAKQLVRNGHLPPGLAYRALPPDLMAQLPPLAPAYRYVIVDDRVMLIRAATNLILDILRVPSL